MRLAVMLSMFLAGCLGDIPGDGAVGGAGGKTDQVDGGSSSDASMLTGDLAISSQPDLSPMVDLFPADIAGMTNCFGVALCDPTVHFCIRFFAGSATAQGGI